MSTVAGHSFDADGVCRRITRRGDEEVTCGMTKRMLRSVVYEYKALNTSGVNEPNIAHVASCTQNEWIEACNMVEAEDRAFDEALKQVCRA